MVNTSGVAPTVGACGLPAKDCIGLPHGLPRDLKPWQRIDWHACAQSRLFNDWGQYYSRRLLFKEALKYYDQSLTVCHDPTIPSCTAQTERMPLNIQQCFNVEEKFCKRNYVTLLKRAKCERSLSKPHEALLNAIQAEYITDRMAIYGKPRIQDDIILEKCDALYDANRFEDNLCMLHENANRFSSINNKKRLDYRFGRTLSVFQDTLGETLGSFFKRNFALVKDVDRKRKTLAAFVPRPLWKERQEQQQCDVQSIQVKPVIMLTQLEKARSRLCYNIFNYYYLGRSAKDVAILRELRGNPNFLSPHLRESSQYLQQFTTEQYSTVRKFLRMMHARNPMYNRNQLKFSHASSCEKRRNDHLYRVEYQTRRDCFRMLREVRQRRREQNIEKLTDYVEHIMSTYIDLKTHRILPWKFEFVNEVYNILGLAHADRCIITPNVDFLNPKNRFVLYKMPSDRYIDNTIHFFGDNLYKGLQKTEERHNRINQKLDQLEYRLRHSRYAIERCYLQFEMARNYFKESRFDKCLVLARKAVYEARNCKSIIWRFNSTFLVCQVHATLNRFERLKESLAKASQLASSLKSQKLLAFLAICTTVNDHDLGLRRMRYADHSVRTKTKKGRVSSSASVSSFGIQSISSINLSSPLRIRGRGRESIASIMINF